jgi:hypothetical protein
MEKDSKIASAVLSVAPAKIGVILAALFIVFPSQAFAQYSPYYSGYYYPSGYPRYETYYTDIYLANPYYPGFNGGYPAGYYIAAGQAARDNRAPSASLAAAAPTGRSQNSAAIGSAAGTAPAEKPPSQAPIVPAGLPNAGAGGAAAKGIGLPVLLTIFMLAVFFVISAFEKKRRLGEEIS